VHLRRGHLLAEALCALALAGLLAATAGLMLTSARRVLAGAEHRAAAERAERETIEILHRALSTGDGVVVRGDTALELDLLLGTGVVCGAEADALSMPAPTGGATALTQLVQLPGADDLVAVRLTDDDVWWYGVADSVQQRDAVTGCQPADGWRQPGAPVLRFSLLDSLPPGIAPGAPVRLLRRGRFTLYHAGSGDWMLGWRRCHPWLEVCGTVQPVAGPLRPPAARGLFLWAGEAPPRLELTATAAGGGGTWSAFYW
jgi:hypothetical protein